MKFKQGNTQNFIERQIITTFNHNVAYRLEREKQKCTVKKVL